MEKGRKADVLSLCRLWRLGPTAAMTVFLLSPTRRPSSIPLLLYPLTQFPKPE